MSIVTPEDLKKAQLAAKNTAFVLFFVNRGDTENFEFINELFIEVQDQYQDVRFVEVDTSDTSSASLTAAFNIQTIPTIVGVLGKTTISRVDGFDAPEIITAIESVQAQADLYKRIDSIINQSKVVLFMKGTRDQPRCGFSRQMIELLNQHNIDYTTFDILSDEAVRQGIKVYSDWPTFPQLYANGELLGGIDIAKEMVADGEFVESLQ